MQRVLRAVGIGLGIVVVSVIGLFKSGPLTMLDRETGQPVSLGEGIMQRLLPGRHTTGLASIGGDYVSYNNSELQIAFRHPACLSPQIRIDKDRDDSGNTIVTGYITAESSSPLISMALVSLADPVTTARPGWYPPDDEALRLYAIYDIGSMASGEGWPGVTDQVVFDAVDKAQITELGGYPAAVYGLEVDRTNYGRLYVKGASVISPQHRFQMVVLGSTEPGAPGSVSVETIGRVWDEFAASLILPD